MANPAVTYIRELLVGTLLFLVIVAGATSYLQNSLVLVKHYDAYMHWAVVLFAIPAVAGVLLRLKKITSPLFSCLAGALASTAILYPLYRHWWASPPQWIDVLFYFCIIFGIAYIATQPLKATFMLAFRLGRYSLSAATSNGNGKGKKQKVRRQHTTTSTRPIYTGHGSVIAMLELMIGICSLVLSIFSIFYMGKG